MQVQIMKITNSTPQYSTANYQTLFSAKRVKTVSQLLLLLLLLLLLFKNFKNNHQFF